LASAAITPDWPAPANILAGTYTRNQQAATPAPSVSLNQVHGTHCVDVALVPAGISADACYSSRPGLLCAVVTADCLPILLCAQDGTEVAAIHAGWRGLVAGVIESTLACLQSDPSHLLAWLGPAISQQHFEVGGEVRAQFLASAASPVRLETQACFIAAGEKYMADLYALARLRLAGVGVTQVWGGQHCTYAEADLFHSYRRDGVSAGRVSTVIAIT
jgi:YfiH family protein